MNFDAFQNFFAGKSEDNQDLRAKEQAQEILKKYKCFKDLFLNNLDLLEQCQDVLLVDTLRNVRNRPEVDRAYLIAFNDTFALLKLGLEKYENAMKELSNGGIY